jgi:hypothetical protein
MSAFWIVDKYCCDYEDGIPFLMGQQVIVENCGSAVKKQYIGQPIPVPGFNRALK